MSETLIKLRLFVEYDLVDGSAVLATDEQHNYLRNVMRCSVGDRVALFNGRDGEWRAVVSQLTKSRCLLTVEHHQRPQRLPPDIWLLFAAVKAAAMNNIARMATELGVARLCPLFTEHTSVTRANTARIRANAIEAAEQTGRLNVPIVDDAQKLGDVMRKWDPVRNIILCAEKGPAKSFAEALSSNSYPGPWAVLIGPEGGFSQIELDALVKLPFVTPARLGPRIMRADTAAIAALVCWQNYFGDWT